MRSPLVTSSEAEPSSEAEWSRRLKHLVVVAAVIATALIVWGVIGAEHKALALEAAKVGMQLAVVTIVGWALTYTVKRIDEARTARARKIEEEREERRRLNDYRLTVYRDSIIAYNKVKTVRRTLRALALPLPTNGPLEPNQLEQFNTHMLTLNEAELSLERVEHEVKAQADVFPNASKRLDTLKTAQRFLRQVLEVWETNALLAAEPDASQRTPLDQLQDFLAKRRDKRTENLPWLIDAFLSAIRTDLKSPVTIAPTAPTAVKGQQDSPPVAR